MSDIPTATPLVEQLKDVPIDGSDCYPISSVHHKNIPYGELCRAAAKEIEQLKRELCEAREALRSFVQKMRDQAAVFKREDQRDNSRWSIFNEGRAQALEKFAEDLEVAK